MDILLTREPSTAACTLGSMAVDGEFECFTLEDIVRPVKIKGMTAIPVGDHEVVVTFSARFKRPLPLLLAVPNFDGVRIHPGNTAKDTEGCILVGQKKGTDQILQSRAAFDALFARIAAAASREKIFIQIVQR
jgi:hypothetical protein